MAVVSLNGAPVLELSLYLPITGAWSAQVQVSSDTDLDEGARVELLVAETTFVGRVIRAGIDAQRLSVRLTGGDVDWVASQPVKHYRDSDVDAVISDVGVTLDAVTGAALPFWTRNPGTTSSTVQSLARRLGFNWRVNPDGTVRLRAEDPQPVDIAGAVEVGRDPARGHVVLAPEIANVLPGTTFDGETVGDVTYDLTERGLRVKYNTSIEGKLRTALHRIIRWVMRDTIFLATYTAKVEAQAADGTLDLLPDDLRLRAQGLQGVPIRHGLPGVTVTVPIGERVLLGFDGGDPAQPYASLWHEGQVTKVNIGGTREVAMADLVITRIEAMETKIDNHVHSGVTTGSGSSGKSTIVWPTAGVASTKLCTD